MSQTQIPTVPGMGRSIIDHDPRNKNFPARGNVFATDAKPRQRVWRRGAAYDQGQTSQCVAYTAKGMLNTLPFSSHAPYDRRAKYSEQEFYDGAQRRDEWPYENYDGTSGLGVMNYLTEIGLVQEYRWCFTLEDYLLTLSHHGPISFGSWWTGGMFYPDSKGFIHMTGSKVGGHQYELIGNHPRIEAVEIMNSWSTRWGNRGRAFMSYDTLDKLRADSGDGHTLVAL